MADEAVLDAPVEELIETVEEPVDIPEVADEPIEEHESPEIDSKQPLWKQLEPKLANLDPRDKNLIKGKLIALENVDRQLQPIGGVKGAVALHTAIGGLRNDPNQTPEQAIHETLQERDYFRGLDDAFTKADPSFVEKMISASNDAGQQSFERIAPAFADGWAKAAPEQFAAYVSKVAIGDMVANEIPLHFSMLKMMFARMPDSPEKAEAADAINAIFQWTEGLKGMAAKPTLPQPKPKSTDDLEKERQTVESGKVENLRVGWNNSSSDHGRNLFSSELTRIAGKVQVTAEQRTQIWNKAAEEYNDLCAADRQYGEAMRSYLASGDKESYRRTLEAKRAKVFPGAIRRAFDDVTATDKPNVAKPGPKPGTVRTAKPVENGFKRISGFPAGKIDHRRTTTSMIDKNQAVLKDGNRVAW